MLQKTHSLPRYHRISTPLTRHRSGATSNSVRHSCPHCFFMGQREQSCSRISGAPTIDVSDACSASTSTMVGLLVSGQVTMREPRYLEADRTSQRKPKKRAATNKTMTINEPGAVSMFSLRFYRL